MRWGERRGSKSRLIVSEQALFPGFHRVPHVRDSAYHQRIAADRSRSQWISASCPLAAPSHSSIGGAQTPRTIACRPSNTSGRTAGCPGTPPSGRLSNSVAPPRPIKSRAASFPSAGQAHAKCPAPSGHRDDGTQAGGPGRSTTTDPSMPGYIRGRNVRDPLLPPDHLGLATRLHRAGPKVARNVPPTAAQSTPS